MKYTILPVFDISEIDIDTHKLLFEDVRVNDRPKQMELIGILFIITGKEKIDCTQGVDRNSRKCLIYHETIGGLVITGRAHRQYINMCLYLYIFVYV